MTCEHNRDLHAWHDGQLSEADRARFAEHLASCRTCQADLRELQGLSGLMRSGRRVSMPTGFVGRLHERVNALGERSILRIAELLTAAAAVILATGLSFLVHRNTLATRAAPAPAEVAAADFTMPDEVVSGVASSGDTIEMAQWVEPNWRVERQP